MIDNTREPQPLSEQVAPLELPEITVAEAMHLAPLQLSATLSLSDAAHTLIERRNRSALVVSDEQQLLGIITIQDVNRLLVRAKSEAEIALLLSQPIEQLCTTKVLFAHADELLAEAIDRMATRGLQQLPVVTREQPQRIIGLLSQEDVTLAQTIAHARQAFQQHLANQHLANQHLANQLEYHPANLIESKP
ncbi:MAG: CBS domain-containing protein [Leptolyngbyaceae cyanobacterium CRU_2_3]|nr:CBS domain-containing protein [Leptolyngbyaceae cyanobacterium CRU_2_3]